MTRTTTTEDGHRAAAIWVAGTGAFLLLAAASVFLAVRWDDLGDGTKLGVVGALTALCLIAGRGIGRTLPGTGSVLFHLGAFLLPVNLAAVGLRLGLEWPQMLLAEGLLGAAAYPLLAKTTGSKVLRWTAAGSVPVLALGIAALSPVPAPLVLAMFAVAGTIAGLTSYGIVWAVTAGLGPVVGAAAASALAAISGVPGIGVLTDFGLAGDANAVAAVVSGAAAAIVLAREATARRDLGLAAAAALSFLSSGAVTWGSSSLSSDQTAVAVASLFLLVQLATLATRDDPFWARPARWVAGTSEIVAAVVGGTASLVFLVAAPIVDEGLDIMSDAAPWNAEPAAAMAFGILAAGWLVAGVRRTSLRGSAPAALAAAAAHDFVVAPLVAAALASVILATVSAPIAAAGFATAGAALALARTPSSRVLAPLAAMWAPVVAHGSAWTAFALGAGAAVVLSEGAVRARRRREPIAAGGFLMIGATVAASLGAAFTAEEIGGVAAAALTISLATAVAAIADRTPGVGPFRVSDIARIGVVVATGVIAANQPQTALPAVALGFAVLVIDSIRLQRPHIAFGAAAVAPLFAAVASRTVGLDPAEAGFATCVAGVVFAGLATLAAGTWQKPLLVACALCTGFGLVGASLDERLFSDAIVIVGAMVIAAGIATRTALVAHVGGLLAIAGVAGHLATESVTAIDAYLVPVAIHLVGAGIHARRTDPAVSSWVAFVPAVALLGGSAVVERLAGGSAWHALAAGAVGGAALVAGGWYRLVGPLFAGTVLLVLVTAVESVALLVGVPTWAWLAAGGSVLLGAGVAIERADQSPVEAGRRVVDVLTERFD